MRKHGKFLGLSVYATVILLLLLSGCVRNEWEEKEERETEVIENYLRENSITEEAKTEGGIYFVEEISGTGRSPEKDDYIVINYVGRYLENGAIHETNYDSLRDDWDGSVYYSHLVYAPLKFKYGYSIAGINEGIGMMKEGGKAKLIIPSDKGFYDFNPLEYEIELIRVIRDPAAYEDSVLITYLSESGFDSTMLTGGIFFRETVTPDPDDQRTVQQNDTILIRYTGRYVVAYSGSLNDTIVFDTNTDEMRSLKLVFGKNEVITGTILGIPDGLAAALDTMRLGTHATAVLPYEEAFGHDGLSSGTYGYTIVPGYQTVLYQLVLEDIRSPLGK
ncbi:MAG: FKBP-type peptidyl-prolyl cis-trans isomerase [Bacteroidales bacterium]|nr:FKBP-type peptidyl-prolyl cis-trans isomerase [Bacteroidales bacterium]